MEADFPAIGNEESTKRRLRLTLGDAYNAYNVSFAEEEGILADTKKELSFLKRDINSNLYMEKERREGFNFSNII